MFSSGCTSGCDIGAPHNRDGVGLARRSVQVERHRRVPPRYGGRLREQIKVRWEENGSVGLLRDRLPGALERPWFDDRTLRCRSPQSERPRGLLHLADEVCPGVLDRARVDRIVHTSRKIHSGRGDRCIGRDAPAGAVEPSKPLAQRVNRCSLGDQAVEIDVDARFDALGGDENQHLLASRPRSSISVTGADRIELIDQAGTIQRSRGSDHQDWFGHNAAANLVAQILLQLAEDLAG